MANDEVLGPRKTMFVLVIVVGCFAVLWPRILSPLILGQTRDQIKPNKFDREAVVKQERPPIRMGTHPALREKGRAIPPGAPAPSKPVVLPAHLRVRSPLSVYFETVDLDIKPPPIPGMRPPLGSPGGPVPAPKTSMGFVMPIYTICIIVFFVYTLSKILFKRTGSSPYEPVAPDPQFRQRVFRDNSRSSPDKFGHKETDTIVTAISGLVAEVQQQMEASYVQNQQRQETVDSTRPYTNGTILLNSGPVQIVASEYRESKEKTSAPQNVKEPLLETKEPVDTHVSKNEQELNSDIEKLTKVPLEKVEEVIEEIKDATHVTDVIENDSDLKSKDEADTELEQTILEPEKVNLLEESDVKHLETEEDKVDTLAKLAEDFLNEERIESTSELLEEALKEDIEYRKNIEEDKDNQSVKVVGMEVTAHSADGGVVPRAAPAPPPAPAPRPHEAKEVTSIFLDTEIPQQSRVLVADFAEDTTNRPEPTKNSSLVVSGKITLSLIQDAPRDTPERDPESTVDDFTTASALTQPAEKEDDLSDGELEEVDEEIEIEEIEEEIEIEEDEDEEEEELESHDLKGKK